MRTNATRMIEDQIAREIDKLNSIFTEEADKPAVIQRIAELKALLDGSPEKEESSQPTTRELISELIAAFRRR